MPWLKKSASAKVKQKPGRFRRSELPEKDLAKLALAYMLSGSQDLKKSAVIVSRFRELDISRAPEFNEEVIRMACKVLVTLAEEGSSTSDRQRLLHVLQHADTVLPTIRDTLQNPVQVNKVLLDLRIKLQDEFPDITKGIKDNTTNYWKAFDSVLAHAIGLLDVVKDAVDLCPVPALKPAFAAAVGMLKIVRDFRSNYAPLNDLTSTTTKFLLLLAEETDGKKQLSPSFQAQVDRLTSSLVMVLEKCERIRSQSSTRKFLFQYADKAALSNALREMQTAIESFKIASVKALITEIQHTNKTINELLEVTGSMLLLALQISASSSTNSVIPDDTYFPHSRDNEIDHIRTWLIGGTSRFLWVQASAAMGKSTLMRQLIDVLEEEGRLGTYYFFEPESKIDLLSVAKLMAYEMALLHPSIRAAMSKITLLPQNHKLHEHLLHLVLQPLSTLPKNSVVIIDALDQQQHSQELLASLQTALEFAPNVKVLFTGRSSSDIKEWTKSNNAVKMYALPPFNDSKMREYFQTQFRRISDWADGPPSGEQVQRLVSMADGHIGWAFYASALICDRGEIPDDMLSNVLDQSPIAKLDAMYREILAPLMKNSDRSRKVLGMLLVIEEPLSHAALNQLAYTQRLKVDEVYHCLCLLRTRGKEYITPISQHFHSSFLEFLRNVHCCSTELYPIPSADAHLLLFRCSARLLKQSTPPGNDNASSYAYEWWPHHIVNTSPPTIDNDYVPFPVDLHKEVRDFVSIAGSGYICLQLEKFQLDLSPPDGDIVEQLHWLSTQVLWSKSNKPLAILNHFISLQQVVVRLSSSSPDYHDKLYILGQFFQVRYDSAWSIDDLEKAIQTRYRALPLSESHPNHPLLAGSLCGLLKQRYESKGNFDDIEDAINLGHQALDLYPIQDPERDWCLGNLATALQSRFKLQGNTQDLEKSIELCSEVLALHSAPHPCRNISLNNLANALYSRFELQGDAQDLDKSIELHSEALALHPAPHPDRSQSLNNLANALQSRFELRGDAQDLEKSIELHSEALALRPAPHPDRSKSLNNLANSLQSRFELRGNAQDLEKSIELHSEALALCPAPHPDRSMSLNNLATALQSRFELQGDAQDLEKSIELHSEALALCPAPRPDRSSSLNNLALALQSRFELQGDAQDLDKSIELHSEALALRPVPHPNRSSSLNNLSDALLTRFKVQGDIQNLNDACQLLDEAISLIPTTSPNHQIVENNLKKCLKLLDQTSGDSTL